ncbi:hypothetical protein V8E51_002444 [Hyaloscypha variabilis]
MATLHRLTRISMLVKRNPALSTHEFQRRWCRIWGPLSAPFLKRIGFNTYLQVPLKTPHTTLQLGGPEFDAFAEFVVPTYEAFLLVWEALFYNDYGEGDEGEGRGREEWLIDPDTALIVHGGFEEVYLFSPTS